MLERLQKILSARGIASRRKAEEYIMQGFVTVNGKVAKVGDKADPETDTIEVSGAVLRARQEMLYFVMYKPVGVLTENISRDSLASSSFGKNRATSNEPTSNKKSVRDLLPERLQGKVYPVGRLDKDSEGLLLLTNDGVLAYRLTHPKFDHEKEYAVEVSEPIMEGQLRKLRHGVKIDAALSKPAVVRRTGPKSFRISITEGRNRQVRRMCQKVGSEVQRLTRVRIVTLEDPSLESGQIRALTQSEKTQLLAAMRV